MNKIEYLNKAIVAKAYFKKEWVISAFSITKESKTPVFPYKLKSDVSGTFFYDPENNLGLTKIEDAVVNKALFLFKDIIKVNNTLCSNLNGEIEDTIGNLLTNLILLVNSFGNKIPYILKDKSISDIENIIAKKLTSNVKEGEIKKDDVIYVEELLKFNDGVTYMKDWSQLCVYAATYKTMTPPTGITEYKKKLFDENKGKLHDPVVLANIEKKLEEYDAAYLKGDPGGDTFANNNKSRKIVRKKLFLMQGASESIVESNHIDPILTSLTDGWEIDKFPQLNNSLRSGSYNRGTQTQLGGVLTKMLLRATSNIQLVNEDCGSTEGITRMTTDNNYKKLVSVYILINNKTILVNDEDEAKAFIGKYVTERSPAKCKTLKGDYCIYCVGKKLSMAPNAISLAASDYGSNFLVMFLKKMHGSSLSATKMDINTALT